MRAATNFPSFLYAAGATDPLPIGPLLASLTLLLTAPFIDRDRGSVSAFGRPGESAAMFWNRQQVAREGLQISEGNARRVPRRSQ